VKKLKRIKGRAWVFGNNVDTDQIIQGRYLTLTRIRDTTAGVLFCSEEE